VAQGTPVTAQAAGNCLKATCDGAGATVNVDDLADVPADDGNPCTDEVCLAGAPAHPAKANGVSCNDDDACSTADSCQAGACVGTAITCVASDQCHAAGACDAKTGACTNPALAEGAACNDGDACTQTDACHAGACTGANPVSCTAPDQCHAAGACNPTTGACAATALADGTVCDDGSACTERDSCQAGTCTGANPVTCTAIDQCHAAGSCNPSNGVCSNPALANGSSCSDGNACTKNDTCQAGTCTGADPITCSALDQCHAAGACDTTTGACSNPPRANGSSCSDGNACTQSDTCQAGTCTGANPITCTALDQCHAAGSCNPTTGVCANPASADGTTCSDGNACTQSDTCQAGTCTGANPVLCTALDQCHASGTCSPSTGVCSAPPAADGTTCSDGNACTQSDTCQAGACTGANPVVCTAVNECVLPGTCTAGTGACSSSMVPAGTPTSAQTPGDCQSLQCDGSGQITSVTNALDVPADEGNQCTDEVCVSGAPSHPPSALGKACNQNGGTRCDGLGDCVEAPAPGVSSVVPADGSLPVAGPTVTVAFTTAMDPATLTAQTAAGACSGSLQVSLDDFATCIAFASSPAMSAGNTKATLTATPGLLVNRTYKVRVTTAAASDLGSTVPSQFTQSSGFKTTSPNQCARALVISQVYGGGGTSAATYKNDFVELRNLTSSPISLAGYSVQYASAAGTSWLAALLTGTVPAGAYFLVQLGGNSGLAALPTPDAIPTNPLNLSGTAGKIALVNGTTALSDTCPVGAAIIDFVGYGTTATCFEGPAPTAATSSTTSVQRVQSACSDLNNNNGDFAVGAPNPRNSTTATSPCSCLALNESDSPSEVALCDTDSPLQLSVTKGTQSAIVYGQVYMAGVTPPAGSNANVVAQLGFGPATANPQYEAGWTWTNASFDVQVGNNDQYKTSLTAPAASGSYRYVYRFSLDHGVSWSYCDKASGDSGSGSNPGLTFELENEAVLTVP
jgi:hypothetical protein